jgi:hypothetical protein
MLAITVYLGEYVDVYYKLKGARNGLNYFINYKA